MRYITRRFCRACLPGMLMMALVAGVSLWAVPPETVNIHGMLVDASDTPLPGERAYVVRFFDAETGGTQLGGDLAGMVEVSPEGLFNLPVLLPPEALAAAELWYELGIDTDMPPDGDAEGDIFPGRIRVHSVPFALEAGTVVQIDADRIGDGTVDNTTFSRLAGVTQPIQAALNAKAAADDLNSHAAATDNPHGVTAAQVGLGDVDNTSDEDKPVSTAMQAALDAKADADDLNSHADARDNPHDVTAAQLGLGNVDNTSDEDKPVSTAMQAALDTKANMAHTHSALDITSGVLSGARIPATIARLGQVWELGGNKGTSPSKHFLGTTDNVALELWVNNERAMRIVPDAISPSLIGGFSDNSIATGVSGATIGGGGSNDNENRVTDHYGVIGGGQGNVAESYHATVGGGGDNTASGAYSTVGGGWESIASGFCATVGGGWESIAAGFCATVGGGWNNDVQADFGTIAGGGPSDIANPTTTNNRVTGYYGTIGGGGNNQAGNDDGEPTTAGYATVGGGRDNTASGSDSTVGGGLDNRASGQRATVGGGYFNNVLASYGTIAGGGPSDVTNPTTTNNRVTGNFGAIGGGGGNQAGNDDGSPGTAIYATVGGGRDNTASGFYSTGGGGYWNTASGYTATVGGGHANTATGYIATVGGGGANTASGSYSTVGGGFVNTASRSYSMVGGGYANTASESYSTVGGGLTNTASSWYATVPGGFANTAQGQYSFAAGRRAKAEHDGAFVWGDSTNEDVTSSTTNEFTARASGGVRFFTNRALDAGVQLAAGGSSWSSVSDRNVKENFAPVDGVEVLEKVAALPISTWNYKSQDASIRHIGPMAQDVYAAFGLGGSDTTITAIDADGIALAAIQGLNQRLEQRLSEKDREIAALRKEITAMKAILQEVTAR